MESIETALRVGRGRVNLHVVDESDPPKTRRALEVLERAALRGLRSVVPRSGALAVLVQLAGGRLRNLPRLRPHHRHRLRPRDARRNQDARGRRGQALADQVVQGMPGRPCEVREEARHPARHAVVRAHRRAAQVGHRRRRQVGKEGLVRRQALLRMARDQGLQDARARAAVALSRVHALHHLQWLAPQARRAAVAHRRPQRARPRADVARQEPRVLRGAQTAARRSTRRRTCCWAKCARALPICARWGWVISRSIASRARSRAARSSAST